MHRRLPPAIVEEGVTARIKWFNPTKGFGFVVPDGAGDRDAFLHASVLPVENTQDLAEGTTIVCDLAQGQKGLMVATVHSVDTSTAIPMEERAGPRPGGPGGMGGPRMGGGFDGPRGPREPAESGEGTVKFFNEAKGFGFVVPDNGGQDVFVSARVLGRSGIHSLDSDQRVRYEARHGDRGPMAERVELI
jgi:CspA family cold shock protein